jgi:transcription initiation factor TFIID subunit 5
MADAAAAAAASAPDPLDRVVLRYLQKRGYKDAEKALLSEAKLQSLSQMALVPHLGADASISDHILYYNEADCDPGALMQGYRLLRDWVHNSLDAYKVKNLKKIIPNYGQRRKQRLVFLNQ